MKRFNKKIGIITRECSKCKGDLGDRYGKQRYCKTCHAAHMRATRPKHSDLKEEDRRKANTRAYTNVLIRRGVLVRGVCEVCGCEKVEPHHTDYNNPREVKWLCREHHMELHKKEKTK